MGMEGSWLGLEVLSATRFDVRNSSSTSGISTFDLRLYRTFH